MKKSPESILPAELLELLEKTPQNPKYHREGNVLAHIRMVLEKVREMANEFSLSESELELMEWAALLHDVGKSATTIWQDERWRSPGHEKAGVPIARDILLANKIPLELRQQILGLVRWHGFPLRFVRFNWAESDLQSLGTITNLRLLSLFSTFDFHGRISEDFEETRQSVDQFRTHYSAKAEFEMGTFEQIQKAWTGWDLRHKNAGWNSIKMRQPLFVPKLMEEKPSENPDPPKWKVFLTIGAPFSGKSHWIAKNKPDAFLVQLKDFGILDEKAGDEFGIHQKSLEMRNLLEIYLRRNGVVYLEGRNLHPRVREKVNTAVRSLGAELTYLVFETPLSTLIGRNLASENPMPEEDLRKAHSNLGIIHPWEAHHIFYISEE